MKRWKKVTLWIASILIVLVVGGLFAANYAVDKLLNSMVGMSVDDLLEEDDASQRTSDPTEGATSTNGNVDTDQDTVGTDDDVTTEDSDQEQPVTDSNPDTPVSNTNSGNTSGGGQSSSSGNASGDGQSGSSGSDKSSSEGSGSSSGYSAEVSTDKAKEVEENITISEKAKVVSTLMGSLSASDISNLQKLASGGLSVEEKKEARTLLLEKLTEDQYNELIAIAAKHGLSQGKKYSEVKDE